MELTYKERRAIVKPLEDKIQQLEVENKRLKDGLEYTRDFIKDLPELNPSNYNHDDVCHLNSGVCEIYSFIEILTEPPKEGTDVQKMNYDNILHRIWIKIVYGGDYGVFMQTIHPSISCEKLLEVIG